MLTPPVGSGMNNFIDTHISWDCTAPSCDMAYGAQALFESGSRGNMGGNVDGKRRYMYSYDPAGYYNPI